MSKRFKLIGVVVGVAIVAAAALGTMAFTRAQTAAAASTVAAAATAAAAVDAATVRAEAAALRSDNVAARNATRRDELEVALAAAEVKADAWKRMALRGLRALEHSCLPGASAQEKLREFISQAGRDEPDAAVRLASRFIDVVGAIDREIEEEQRIREGLQCLLALLCDNVRQLAPDEVWLAGQLEPIRALLAGPIRSAQIAVAESRLASLIAQQTTARKGLKEAKIALTEMLATLLDRVGAMDTSAQSFSETVSSFQAELTGLDDASALARVVQGLLAATSTVRNQIDASRADLVEARKKVETYEARVSELEQQLSQVSTLVQKDPLTNALNRRGLERAFEVETARARRYGTPLTLALMDLDDFKKVNDTLGHVAGDRALIHFVTTVHATMRPTDLTARAGGEEFSVLFPATDLQQAAEVVERLQRDLAQRPFAFENQRTILSFSSGVAQWQAGESLEDLMKRADAGLYEAKRAGKNRVVSVKTTAPGPSKEPTASSAGSA
jgi:diguanylate cyclase